MHVRACVGVCVVCVCVCVCVGVGVFQMLYNALKRLLLRLLRNLHCAYIKSGAEASL